MNPDVLSFYDVEPLAEWLQAGVPVITPNYRLARHIKLAWGQRQQQAGISSWETPLVLSLEHWWLHCRRLADPWGESSVALATDAQELELWLRCIRENPHSGNLLRPRGAAQLARDAYRNLLLWQLDWRREPLATEFRLSADAALFVHWAEHFEKLCAELELQLLPSQVAELARRAPCAALVLAEMAELPPLYEQALQSQAGQIHRHQHLAESAACKLQACQDSEQELYCAARWANTTLREHPNSSIAILLPELSSQQHRFKRILREVFAAEGAEEGGADELPVNFSGGVPLSSTATVRCALALLSLQDSLIEVEPLVQLLHSRYRDQGARAAEIQLIRKLYQHGRASISANQLRYFCRELPLGKQLLQLSQQRELKRQHPPSHWCELLSEGFQTLRWPGAAPLDSNEHQQLEHWYQCLERMADLDEVCGLVGYQVACSLLQQLCSDEVFQVQTADAPIQVLGLLEAAGLQFEHMWLSGVSSSDWPAPAQPNPFIPFGLQKQQGMPHADSRREHHYAQRLLQQYQHCSKQLVASYAEVQDEVAQRPSPLLREFAALPMQAAISTPGNWREPAVLPLEQLPVETRAPALGDDEAANLRGGSGLIQDQSHCGFRAFVQHRLKARNPGELSVGLTAADRGTMLHDALFHLWGKLGDSDSLHALDETARQALVATAVNAAIDAFLKHHRDLIGRAYLRLEETHLQQLLQEWLEIEAQRSAFVVQAREAGCEIQFGKLQLRLRIDRIDTLPGGEQLIVDYKSGNTDVRYWLGPRPREPQLPLYSEALGPSVSGVSFAVVKPGDAGWRGLARAELGPGINSDIARASASQEQPLEDWEALRESWRHTLGDLAQQFIDGQARVDPLDTRFSCRWCGLQALCRIEEVIDLGEY
ncbi:MAG: PD-(D/E)XK nuclease family protein [Gammaproteobacteria bacterium]|nr:PD-(D/E)XK nuclease family protein [Gammaproteobacteria bacterium]